MLDAFRVRNQQPKFNFLNLFRQQHLIHHMDDTI
jgi:hypothetical protein